MDIKQKLIWVPEARDVGLVVKKVDPIPYDGEMPKFIWTLFKETKKNVPPTLPIKPLHHVNAFLEDRIHDWDIVNSTLRYYSRISEGNHWILLEFE